MTETLAAIKNGGDAVLCPEAGSKAAWRLPLLYEPPAEAAGTAGSTGATAAAAAAPSTVRRPKRLTGLRMSLRLV
jgi:hypothetical protein